MAKIGGAIVDNKGQVIPSATVVLRDPSGREVAKDTTDDAGEWFIDNENTEASAYYIDINKPGYGQAIYPSAAAPSIIEITQLEIPAIPKWVWIVAAVLVLGGVILLVKNIKE